MRQADFEEVWLLARHQENNYEACSDCCRIKQMQISNFHINLLFPRVRQSWSQEILMTHSLRACLLQSMSLLSRFGDVCIPYSLACWGLTSWYVIYPVMCYSDHSLISLFLCSLFFFPSSRFERASTCWSIEITQDIQKSQSPSSEFRFSSKGCSLIKDKPGKENNKKT
jgi:hypothetical protein